MKAIKLTVDGEVFLPTEEQAKAVDIEMWYDRHYRHWVLYPVDADGTQIAEASYGFGKKEALRIKSELEAEYGIKEA